MPNSPFPSVHSPPKQHPSRNNTQAEQETPTAAEAPPKPEQNLDLVELQDVDDSDDDSEFSSDYGDRNDVELYQRKPLLPTTNINSISPQEDGYYQRAPNGSAVRIDLPVAERRHRNLYPSELKKLGVGSLFLVANFIATAAALSVTHEFRPETGPLPDQVLDNVNFQKWGLHASEYLLQVETLTAALILLFHRHRCIILRRLCVIVGLLYGYRAVTMFVTNLPPADPSYYCAPKLAEEGKHLTVWVVMKRVFKILSGFGLSINGEHVYCGDYIFSGHTMTVVTCWLIVTEYTPKRWFLLHWLILLCTCSAIVCLLIGRGHYTVDVVIAYYITTRLWWIYHTMASHQPLKQGTVLNSLSKMWWFPLFRWFEINYPGGPLPFAVSLPLPKALRPKFLRWSKLKRRRTKRKAESSMA